MMFEYSVVLLMQVAKVESVVDTTGAGETLLWSWRRLMVRPPPSFIAGDAIAGALLAACALDQPLQEGLRWRLVYIQRRRSGMKGGPTQGRYVSGGGRRKQPR